MDKKKHYQKQALNRDDNKVIVNSAKALKGIASTAGAIALIVFNKNNIKTVIKGMGKVVRTIRK